MALQGMTPQASFQGYGIAVGTGPGTWQRLHTWTLQGDPKTLVTGDVLPGSNGVPLTVALNQVGSAPTLSSAGITVVNTSAATTTITASLADLLGRAWNPADTVAMLFEVDPVALPLGGPTILGMLLDQPTPATFLETYQAGWAYSSSQNRAWAQWWNTSGVFQTSVNAVYTTSGGFDLAGGIFAGYSIQGFAVAGAALPPSGVTSLSTGGSLTSGLMGASVSATPTHAGIWMSQSTAGTAATIRNAGFYLWRA